MTPELANYLQQLPSDQSRVIWLEAISKMAKNGTSNVIYRDLMQTHMLSLKQVKTLFSPDAAAKLGLLRILTQTDSFISLNFKVKRVKKAMQETPSPAPPDQSTVEPKPGAVSKPLKKSSHTKEAAVVPATVVPVDEMGLVIGPVPDKYEPSGGLHRILVGDYCRFYKEMIQYKASLVGHLIEKPLNPKITPYDGKAFKELAIYFGANGFSTEQNIRKAFLRIYAAWQHLPYNYQNFFSPAQINRNINGIYAEMIQLNNKPKHTNRKDAELAEKIRENRSEDYSHMVRPGS